MKLKMLCLPIILIILWGCAQAVRPSKTDLRDRLLDNLARDLAEIHLMVESARTKYQSEIMSFRVLESWTLFPDTEIRKVTPSKARIYNVLQKSAVEVSTLNGPNVVHVLKIQGEEGVFIGIEKPGRVGTYHMGVFSEEHFGGYLVRFYDAEIAKDPDAVKAIGEYLSMTSRMEKAANTILKKLMELHNKYKTTQIQIESFHVNFPMISIDIQFKFKAL